MIIEQLRRQTLREDHPFAGADPDHVTAVAVLIADLRAEMTPLPDQIVLLLRSEQELGRLKTGIFPVTSGYFRLHPDISSYFL